MKWSITLTQQVWICLTTGQKNSLKEKDNKHKNKKNKANLVGQLHERRNGQCHLVNDLFNNVGPTGWLVDVFWPTINPPLRDY